MELLLWIKKESSKGDTDTSRLKSFGFQMNVCVIMRDSPEHGIHMKLMIMELRWQTFICSHTRKDLRLSIAP